MVENASEEQRENIQNTMWQKSHWNKQLEWLLSWSGLPPGAEGGDKHKRRKELDTTLVNEVDIHKIICGILCQRIGDKEWS